MIQKLKFKKHKGMQGTIHMEGYINSNAYIVEILLEYDCFNMQ